MVRRISGGNRIGTVHCCPPRPDRMAQINFCCMSEDQRIEDIDVKTRRAGQIKSLSSPEVLASLSLSLSLSLSALSYHTAADREPKIVRLVTQ